MLRNRWAHVVGMGGRILRNTQRSVENVTFWLMLGEAGSSAVAWGDPSLGVEAGSRCGGKGVFGPKLPSSGWPNVVVQLRKTGH